ncbi:hypothetical protein [Victivallis sp. Marseille-Q1083]|nr:hypothetical protein [Victivallis sp. Marseille-Q1083]
MAAFWHGRREMCCWFSVAYRKPEEAMRRTMADKIRLFGSVRKG